MNFPKILIYFIWSYYVSSSGIGERTISRKRYGISLSECPETKSIKTCRRCFKCRPNCRSPWIWTHGHLWIRWISLDDQTFIRKDQIDKILIFTLFWKLPDELGILIYSYLRCPYSIWREFANFSMKIWKSIHLAFILISSIESGLFETFKRSR